MTVYLNVFSPGQRIDDDNGDPIASGTIEFYDAGTSTPRTVYADKTLSTSLGTTVSLNAAGYPVTSGNARTLIYPGLTAFKIIAKDANDATVWTHDNVLCAVELPATDDSALSETPVVSKTTTYTVVAGDQGKMLNCNCTSASFVVTLLSAVTAGDGFEVTIRHVGTANQVTVRTAGTETISHGGKASYSVALKGYGQTLVLVSDGANWQTKASSPPRMLDGAPTFNVVDRLTATPSSPTPGARYILTGSPTGAWSTLGFTSGQVAEADGNGSWFAYTPSEGWKAWVEDEHLLTVYSSGAWVDWTNTTAPTSSTLECAVFEHQESNGTVGGTATTAAWTKRTLNTSVKNTITDCSLATSQITLPVGTYLINFWQSLHATTGSQSRIKVVSGTATPDPILHGYYVPYASDSGGDNPLTIVAPPSSSSILTVTATAVIELQYWVAASAGGTSALGAVSAEPTGSNEVYARVTILDLASIQGPQGSQGTQGTDGLDASFDYAWNTATSGDPGSGKIRGNNATVASITEIGIHKLTASGADIETEIATWDDSTSSVRAKLYIVKEGSPGNRHTFSISGAGTDAGDYWTFPVTYVGTAGTISNADAVAVNPVLKGDKGDTGATGSTGSTGATGATGATGPNTGLDYAWATATSGDPGSGKVLANNATLASATAINISKTGRNSESLGAVIATWDDSTNTAHYGHLRIFTVADRTEYIEAEVTGLTDNSTYYTVAVTVTAANGTPSANDVMAVMFERTGNAPTAEISQNSKSADYTLVLGDANKHILHPSADTSARTFTIPANASVAFPVGTCLTFVNQNGAGDVTIAITSDTMRLAGIGTTGSRTLADNGMATALKLTTTEWIINGTGLT